jgi:hypothetical protein
MALKLLFNLSFDPTLREVLVKNSLIPKLVELLKKPPFRALSLRILYHLSMDDRCKSMFTYTEAIPIVMQLVVRVPHVSLLSICGRFASQSDPADQLSAKHCGQGARRVGRQPES